MSARPDLSDRIGDIARRLLGLPNEHLSSREQLRFGTNGSVAVDIAGPSAGTWYDFEEKTGGGVWELLELKGGMIRWSRYRLAQIRIQYRD